MYIGNTPAENYASFLTETFTVSATTNYTLSHAVTNENDIRLVINGVVQQPGSGKAYTASNTTLTLTSATQSGDSMYAVYLGRALQTVNPPNASVGNLQTAPTIITGQTAEASIATDDTILIHDTSASALKKMTRANFVSGVGGVNTPAFEAYLSSDQSYSSGYTKVQFNAERFDTANAYDSSSNYRFTVPSGQGGKYFIGAQVLGNSSNENGLSYNFVAVYKNGSIFSNTSQDYRGDRIHNAAVVNSGIYDLSAGNYLEVYVLLSGTGTVSLDADNGNVTNQTRFYGFKLIE